MYDVWADPRPCALTPQESIACLSLVCVGLCWEVVFADALTRISSHTREIHTTCLDPRSMDLGIAPTRLSARLPGGGRVGRTTRKLHSYLGKACGYKKAARKSEAFSPEAAQCQTSIFVSTPPVQMLSKNGLSGPKRRLFGVYGFRVKP